MGDRAARLADVVTEASGSTLAVALSVWVVAVWLAGLPFVPGGVRNDSYQLLINTTTTIITFLMVFFIQSSSNRDARALHTKLDALIAANEQVSSRLVGLERRSAADIKAAQAEVHADSEPPAGESHAEPPAGESHA